MHYFTSHQESLLPPPDELESESQEDELELLDDEDPDELDESSNTEVTTLPIIDPITDPVTADVNESSRVFGVEVGRIGGVGVL